MKDQETQVEASNEPAKNIELGLPLEISDVLEKAEISSESSVRVRDPSLKRSGTLVSEIDFKSISTASIPRKVNVVDCIILKPSHSATVFNEEKDDCSSCFSFDSETQNTESLSQVLQTIEERNPECALVSRVSLRSLPRMNSSLTRMQSVSTSIRSSKPSLVEDKSTDLSASMKQVSLEPVKEVVKEPRLRKRASVVDFFKRKEPLVKQKTLKRVMSMNWIKGVFTKKKPSNISQLPAIPQDQSVYEFYKDFCVDNHDMDYLINKYLPENP